MGLRTAEQYREGLRDGRHVYYLGERVADVTRHPLIKLAVDSYAHQFDLQHQPPYRDLAVVTTPEGEPSSRFYTLPSNQEELRTYLDLLEASAGYATVKMMGATALQALMVAVRPVDDAHGTSYAERALALLRRYQREDLTSVLAMSDTKGDRSLGPSEQVDPDLYLRVVERTEGGIVVRGAKASITGAPAADEIIVLPTKAMKEKEGDYAVAFAVPAATPGVKMLCNFAGRPGLDPFDAPLSHAQVWLDPTIVFDDVVVPWERVFLCGEWEATRNLAVTFGTFVRMTELVAEPAKVELFLGAAQLIAQLNGLDKVPAIREKIGGLIIHLQLLLSLRDAALATTEVAEGVAVPGAVATNLAKMLAADRYYDMVKTLVDVAGGGVATAPTAADLRNPETAHYVRKYYQGGPGVTAEQRLRAFKLIHDLTASEHAGYDGIITLHGAGSIGAQRASLMRSYDLGRAVARAKAAAGITD